MRELIVLVALMGCREPTRPDAGAMEVKNTPRWIEVAERSARPVRPAVDAIAALDAPARTRVEAALESFAATPRAPESIGPAVQAVLQVLDGLATPEFAGSGDEPAQSALRSAASLVLVGLVIETARAADDEAGPRLLALIPSWPTIVRGPQAWLGEEARRVIAAKAAEEER